MLSDRTASVTHHAARLRLASPRARSKSAKPESAATRRLKARTSNEKAPRSISKRPGSEGVTADQTLMRALNTTSVTTKRTS